MLSLRIEQKMASKFICRGVGLYLCSIIIISCVCITPCLNLSDCLVFALILGNLLKQWPAMTSESKDTKKSEQGSTDSDDLTSDSVSAFLFRNLIEPTVLTSNRRCTLYVVDD